MLYFNFSLNGRERATQRNGLINNSMRSDSKINYEQITRQKLPPIELLLRLVCQEIHILKLLSTYLLLVIFFLLSNPVLTVREEPKYWAPTITSQLRFSFICFLQQKLLESKFYPVLAHATPTNWMHTQPAKFKNEKTHTKDINIAPIK